MCSSGENLKRANHVLSCNPAFDFHPLLIQMVDSPSFTHFTTTFYVRKKVNITYDWYLFQLMPDFQQFSGLTGTAFLTQMMCQQTTECQLYLQTLLLHLAALFGELFPQKCKHLKYNRVQDVVHYTEIQTTGRIRTAFFGGGHLFIPLDVMKPKRRGISCRQKEPCGL